MTKKLLDLSGKIDGSIPVFEDITGIADALGIPFFVIGATARDLILEVGYGIRSFRATKDLDLAIQVENWEKYNTLSAALLETGLFSESRSHHTFIYNKGELYIDIIPFGLCLEPVQARTRAHFNIAIACLYRAFAGFLRLFRAGGLMS